jgi:hypothetical protein
VRSLNRICRTRIGDAAGVNTGEYVNACSVLQSMPQSDAKWFTKYAVAISANGFTKYAVAASASASTAAAPVVSAMAYGYLRQLQHGLTESGGKEQPNSRDTNL